MADAIVINLRLFILSLSELDILEITDPHLNYNYTIYTPAVNFNFLLYQFFTTDCNLSGFHN